MNTIKSRFLHLLHKGLWLELHRTGSQRKTSTWVMQWVIKNNKRFHGYFDTAISYLCFACQACKKCSNCPARWPGGTICNKGLSPYHRWKSHCFRDQIEADFYEDYRKATALQVANIPWKDR